VRKVVDLGSAVPVQVIDQGNIALSLLITSATVGVAFEVRCGTSGDWIGPFVGVGDWPMTILLGEGLPLSDLNRGVFVRAPTPTPGATLVLNASFGDGAGAAGAGGVAAAR
jgi:hypothetical protein